MRPSLLALALAACSTPGPVSAPPAAAAPAATGALAPSAALSSDAGPGHSLTRSEPVADTLFGQRVADPYRWLEDEKSAEVQAWMAAQDSEARAFLDRLAGRAVLQKQLERLFYVGSVRVPEVRAARLFYEKRSANQEKAVLCWRDGEGGEEHVLLDPNGWNGGKTSLGRWVPSWDGQRVAFAQRPNNADEAVLQVVEVGTGKWSDVLQGAKYADPSWTPDNRGF